MTIKFLDDLSPTLQRIPFKKMHSILKFFTHRRKLVTADLLSMEPGSNSTEKDTNLEAELDYVVIQAMRYILGSNSMLKRMRENQLEDESGRKSVQYIQEGLPNFVQAISPKNIGEPKSFLMFQEDIFCMAPECGFQ